MDFKLWLETEKYRAIKNLWKARGAPDHFMSPFKDPHRWPWPEYEIGGGKRVPQQRYDTFGRSMTGPENPVNRLAKGYVGGVLTSLRKTMYPRGDFPVTYNLGLNLPGFDSIKDQKGINMKVFLSAEDIEKRKAEEDVEIYAMAVEQVYLKLLEDKSKDKRDLEPFLDWNNYQVELDKDKGEGGITAKVFIPMFKDIPMRARLKSLRKGKGKTRRSRSTATLDPHHNTPTPEDHSVADYSTDYPG